MQMHNLLNDCAGLLDILRRKKPLAHHITNYVTVNDCANITLAIGASPVMADAIEEAADITAISAALVLNIGTLNGRTVDSMLAAGRQANALGIPIVLDPVGVGASAYRNETATALLDALHVDVIRGNISEIRFLAGLSSATKGVDASESDNTDDAANIAAALAKSHNCTVAITGAVDIVSNGTRTVALRNGHPAMATVTGTGCMCSSLVGSFCGAARNQIFEATIAALLCMGIAGERAFSAVTPFGSGSFRMVLIDEISRMDARILSERGRLNGNE